MKTLVIGSANVDITLYVERFPNEGETLIAKSLKIDVGGKGLNQAVALKRAGSDVRYLAAVGDDDHADLIRKALDKEGISYQLIEKQGIATGSAYIIVNAKGENMIVIDKGANGVISLSDIDEHVSLIKETDFIVLQNEIPLTVTAHVMELAKRMRKTVIFNPAPFVPISDNLFPYVDLIVPNETELALLTHKGSTAERCRELISKGVRRVIVTLGDKGSLYVNGDTEVPVQAVKVNAIDTVAAGDTYVGYLVAGLADGLEVLSAMRRAGKAAAIAVTRKGALESIPLAGELREY